jgi:hypothetical protein
MVELSTITADLLGFAGVLAALVAVAHQTEQVIRIFRRLFSDHSKKNLIDEVAIFGTFD